MPRYSNFIQIPEDKKYCLPISYNFITHHSKRKVKKDIAYFGLSVERFGTSIFYPSGHHKPISKIVNLKIFGDGK